MSAGVWVRWKNVTLVKAYVAEKVENRHANRKETVEDGRCLCGGQSDTIEVDKDLGILGMCWWLRNGRHVVPAARFRKR